ncbi:unnamed protein product [Linum tenue]|uniref:Uncharacterized protein n=1 Tax=Linum tenue TaxID=586396 RepID=A0AAV0Q523_9ROSI|nr:unnamed protein product [Linum tenue]
MVDAGGFGCFTAMNFVWSRRLCVYGGACGFEARLCVLKYMSDEPGFSWRMVSFQRTPVSMRELRSR